VPVWDCTEPFQIEVIVRAEVKVSRQLSRDLLVVFFMVIAPSKPPVQEFVVFVVICWAPAMARVALSTNATRGLVFMRCRAPSRTHRSPASKTR
jgi:hypothetical protein